LATYKELKSNGFISNIYKLIPCSQTFLEKLSFSWSRNSLPFMEPKVPLLCPWQPNTGH